MVSFTILMVTALVLVNFSIVVTENDVCQTKLCIRKCCAEDSVFVQQEKNDSTVCEPVLHQPNSHPFLVNRDFGIMYSQSCNNSHYSIKVLLNDLKNPVIFNKDNLTLQVDKLKSVKLWFSFEEFCYVKFNDTPGILVCLGKDLVADQSNRLSIYVGMIISMPFLLVTFLVYLLLPDRNLHQKALMFYVLALFFAYILLVTINLSQNISDPWCSVVGYATLFSFMVSFFWMNVICFDIWYTFSGGRGFAGSKKSSERKRLIVYGVYAFGMPLLLIVLIYVLDIYLPENSVHRPDVGRTKCFLSDGWANLWYFYGEAGILVLANIIFFALTALKIRKVKQETSMLKHSDSKRHSYEKDKQKFNLYVKLLFAMGVNWSMEVISWLVNWQTDADVQYIFYITDFFNAVYGVWIFLIFVFKRKIWMLLKKRYYNLIGKPHLAHTVTSTQTRTSNYSSTNYSTADTHLADRGSTTNGNGRQVPEEVALRQVT